MRRFWDGQGPTYLGWGIMTGVLALIVTFALVAVNAQVSKEARPATSLAVGVAVLLIWSVVGGLIVRPRSGRGTVALIALVADVGLVVGFAVAEAGIPCVDDCSNGYAIGLMAIAVLSYLPILIAASIGKALARHFTSAGGS